MVASAHSRASVAAGKLQNEGSPRGDHQKGPQSDGKSKCGWRGPRAGAGAALGSCFFEGAGPIRAQLHTIRSWPFEFLSCSKSWKAKQNLPSAAGQAPHKKRRHCEVQNVKWHLVVFLFCEACARRLGPALGGNAFGTRTARIKKRRHHASTLKYI